jgi:hypothetical protein
MRKITAKEGEDLVSLIQRTAVAAGQAYDRQGQAFEAEHEAEVALLEKAIELARPGLSAISNQIAIGTKGVELVEGLFLTEEGQFLDAGKLANLTPGEVMETWDLGQVLRPLATLFEKQVKGREPSSLAAEKRVAKLLALVDLM